MSATDSAARRQLDSYRILADLHSDFRDVGLYIGHRVRGDSRDGADGTGDGSGIGVGRPVALLAASTEVAADPGYRLRFWAEANKSRRLATCWTAPVADVADRASTDCWVAYDCLPALPLPTAMGRSGAALPELFVRSLGAALAEGLLATHSQGLVYAGISPDSVLLTAKGPRLSGYGLVRAASPPGSERHVVPGVPDESLAPEQRAGDEPRPPGDVYALGSVLAYAATGSRMPQPADLPPTLRQLIAACLSPDPAHRPPTDEVLRQLRDGPVHSPDQLPEAVAGSLRAQAQRHPALVPEAAPAALAGIADPDRETVRSARPSSPSRRMLIHGAIFATSGLALGAAGTAVWRGTRRRQSPRPPRLAVPGTAPEPLWRYRAKGQELRTLVRAGGARAVVAGDTGLIAIDLRLGKQVWARDDVYPVGSPIYLGEDDLLVPESGQFSLISARSGRVKWREQGYGAKREKMMSAVLAGRRGTVWFLADDLGKDGTGKRKLVVAYRTRDRQELWRSVIPSNLTEDNQQAGENGQVSPVLLGQTLLLPNNHSAAAGDDLAYYALGLRDGKRRWEQRYPQVDRLQSGLLTPLPGNLLVAAVRDGYRDAVGGFDLSGGKERWRIRTRSLLTAEAAVRDSVLYCAGLDLTTYALDTRRGSMKWKTEPIGPPAPSSGKMMLSESGRTVLQSTEAEVDAFDARTGTPRWRFATVPDGSSTTPAAFVAASTAGMVVIASGSTLYALPAD